jgi:hypothetical protein
MYYDTPRDHSRERMPPSETRVLCDMVDERKCPHGLIEAVAPPRLERETQRVMDRLLRECLKRKPLMP